MVELVTAAWAVSAIWLFLPVRPVARLVARPFNRSSRDVTPTWAEAAPLPPGGERPGEAEGPSPGEGAPLVDLTSEATPGANGSAEPSSGPPLDQQTHEPAAPTEDAMVGAQEPAEAAGPAEEGAPGPSEPIAPRSLSTVRSLLSARQIARVVRFRPAWRGPEPQPAERTPLLPGEDGAADAVEQETDTDALAVGVGAVLIEQPVQASGSGRFEERDAPVRMAEPLEPARAPDPSPQQPVAPAPGPADEIHDEPPGASVASGVTRRATAWRLLAWLATVAFYVVFIGSSIYLAPVLLARALDTEHPTAAVTSQSMYPVLKRGDLVFIKGVDSVTDLRERDIIAFSSGEGFVIHRIVEIDGDTITTKGDANRSPDEPITFDDVIGRAWRIRGHLARIPYLGNVPLLFGGTSEPEDGNVPPVYERETEGRDRGSSVE